MAEPWLRDLRMDVQSMGGVYVRDTRHVERWRLPDGTVIDLPRMERRRWANQRTRWNTSADVRRLLERFRREHPDAVDTAIARDAIRRSGGMSPKDVEKMIAVAQSTDVSTELSTADTPRAGSTGDRDMAAGPTPVAVNAGATGGVHDLNLGSRPPETTSEEGMAMPVGQGEIRQCPHCEKRSRPGPLARHIHFAHRDKARSDVKVVDGVCPEPGCDYAGHYLADHRRRSHPELKGTSIPTGRKPPRAAAAPVRDDGSLKALMDDWQRVGQAVFQRLADREAKLQELTDLVARITSIVPSPKEQKLRKLMA